MIPSQIKIRILTERVVYATLGSKGLNDTPFLIFLRKSFLFHCFNVSFHFLNFLSSAFFLLIEFATADAPVARDDIAPMARTPMSSWALER